MTVDSLIWVALVLTWILILPMLALELWLSKRRVHRYHDALKQIADAPMTDEGHRLARNAARVLIYDWKW